MDFVNLPLFAAVSLVFASVLVGLFSARIGLCSLVVFLLAGILVGEVGEDGVGGLRCDDFRLSFWVGNLALAIILPDGGLRTAFATGTRRARSWQFQCLPGDCHEPRGDLVGVALPSPWAVGWRYHPKG